MSPVLPPNVLPCSREGCDHPASRYPRVLMMAAGHRRGQSEPLAMLVPLPLCVVHQDDFDPQDFLGDESRRRLRAALMRRGTALPDFSSAWVEWARIGDRDWQGLHQKVELATLAAEGRTLQ